MEEWQNGHDQPGYHYHQEQERKPVETPGKRFWKMWGPLLIKWGIGIGVGMAVMAAMMMAYMKTHYQTQAALEALMSDQNKLMAFYEKMLNKYIDYTTWSIRRIFIVSAALRICSVNVLSGWLG